MVSGKSVKIPLPKTKTLIVRPKFYKALTEIIAYGFDKFGAKVTYDFYETVLNKIAKLPVMPDIHPKNRFIESTDKKVFRNILVDKYAILYSVTARNIHVLTIYHTAINPDTIKNLENK